MFHSVLETVTNVRDVIKGSCFSQYFPNYQIIDFLDICKGLILLNRARFKERWTTYPSEHVDDGSMDSQNVQINSLMDMYTKSTCFCTLSHLES